jgi:hypothetical protein
LRLGGVFAEQHQRRRAQRRRRNGPHDGYGNQYTRACAGDKGQSKKRRAGEGGCRHDPDTDAAQRPLHFVGGNADGEIADREDRLIEHQQQDHRAGRDTGGGGELRQVDDVDRPGQREEKLQNREVPGKALGHGFGSVQIFSTTLPKEPRSTAS